MKISDQTIDAEGLGLTKQRKAVLTVIRRTEKHLTASEVFDMARGLLPGISFATVYNSLRYLKNEGLIHEVSFGSDAARYDRITERHDHALCSKCGKLTDMDVPIPKEFIEQASEISDFKPESIVLTLRGLCPDCI